MEYYDLDLVVLGEELARSVPGVTEIRLFGSRKYLGKVRSDVDLLVKGAPNLPALLDFRKSKQHYEPLDLWLETGAVAVSAVTGSILEVAHLGTLKLYPTPDSSVADSLRIQKFRSDINYAMTVVPPPSMPSQQTDALGIRDRLPALLDPSPDMAVQGVVRLLENAIDALSRMRADGNARRGRGTQVSLLTEYDFQNLTELTLAPIVSLQREAFVVRVGGKDRTVDFSLSRGRIAMELKFAKTSSELNSQLKDAHGILGEYLEHPGVEIAFAVIAIAEGVRVDHNAIESWGETASGGRRAFIKTITVPSSICGS